MHRIASIFMNNSNCFLGGVLPQLFPHLPIVPQIIGASRAATSAVGTSTHICEQIKTPQPEKRVVFARVILHYEAHLSIRHP